MDRLQNQLSVLQQALIQPASGMANSSFIVPCPTLGWLWLVARTRWASVYGVAAVARVQVVGGVADAGLCSLWGFASGGVGDGRVSTCPRWRGHATRRTRRGRSPLERAATVRERC